MPNTATRAPKSLSAAEFPSQKTRVSITSAVLIRRLSCGRACGTSSPLLPPLALSHPPCYEMKFCARRQKSLNLVFPPWHVAPKRGPGAQRVGGSASHINICLMVVKGFGVPGCSKILYGLMWTHPRPDWLYWASKKEKCIMNGIPRYVNCPSKSAILSTVAPWEDLLMFGIENQFSKATTTKAPTRYSDNLLTIFWYFQQQKHVRSECCSFFVAIQRRLLLSCQF